MVAAYRVGRWSRARGSYLFHRQGGLASVQSPKHYPIELARLALKHKRDRAKALAPLLAEKKRYGLV